jgi:ribosome-binding factor A
MGFSSMGRGRGGPVRPVRDDDFGFGAKPDYKTAALCKQVRRSVAMTLAGECADELLQGLIVDDVLPAPNAGRLLVRLVLRPADTAVTLATVLERLEKVHGLLRARVGETIVRKRTPELAFDVVLLHPPAEGGAA